MSDFNATKGELVPGGMALVVGCYKDPANIGRIVITEREMFEGDLGPNGGVYMDSPGWLCLGSDVVRMTYGGPVKSDHFYADTAHLLPIKPEAEPVQIKAEQEQLA